MANRKYTKFGETPVAFECSKPKCKWQGVEKSKTQIKNRSGWLESVCPKCGNPEFYGLIEIPK